MTLGVDGSVQKLKVFPRNRPRCPANQRESEATGPTTVDKKMFSSQLDFENKSTTFSSCRISNLDPNVKYSPQSE